MGFFVFVKNLVVSSSGFHGWHYYAEIICNLYILSQKIKCVKYEGFITLCFGKDCSKCYTAWFLKALTLLRVCVFICLFSTTHKAKRSTRISVNFIYLFCGGFAFFLTGTSSGWSCSFDGTPDNDVYAAWSKANKPFCTCF